MPDDDVILAVDTVHATYNHAITALHGVSFELRRGQILALLGANGAGKTTTLKAVSNLLPAERGQVNAGTIRYEGSDVSRRKPGDLVRAGLVQVLEGRHCFKSLTVEENLVAGGIGRSGRRAEINEDLERIYGYFPAQGKAPDIVRSDLRRRAADDGHRPGADVAAASAGPRRTVDGARPAHRPGHLPDA
jgi:branched-chain amino acid transport system ATP-binding protein